MLQKTLALGVCSLMIVGCSTSVPQTQTEPKVVEQVTQDSNFVQREQTQATEERARETKRQNILTKIKLLEQDIELLSERMQGRQQKLSKIELQSDQLKTDLKTFQGNVKAFMMKHQAEVACIEAAGVSFLEDNQYSKEVKNTADFVTLACGVGALSNGEFIKKIFHVVDQLNQADSYAKNLQSQINAVEAKMGTETEQLEAENAEFSQLKSAIQEYQAQLEAV
jgi:peptidoglycan hydrolase CwlO-like protein